MKRQLKYPLDYIVVETSDSNRIISRSRNLENGLLQLRRAETRAKKSTYPNRFFKLLTPADKPLTTHDYNKGVIDGMKRAALLAEMQEIKCGVGIGTKQVILTAAEKLEKEVL